jgi:hypothetical protein
MDSNEPDMLNYNGQVYWKQAFAGSEVRQLFRAQALLYININ